MTNSNGKNQSRNKRSIIILICSFLIINTTKAIEASSLIPIENNTQTTAIDITRRALFFIFLNPILNQFGIFEDMLDTFPANRINSQQPISISHFSDMDNHRNLHIMSFRSYILNLENNMFGTATIIDTNNASSLLIRLRSNDNFDLGIIINSNNRRDNYRLVHYNDMNDHRESDQVDLLSILCLTLNSNVDTINRIRINNGGLSNLPEMSELAWFHWNSNFALNVVIPRIMRTNNERYLTSDNTFMVDRANYQNLLRSSYGNNDEDNDKEESEIVQLRRNSAFSLEIFSTIYPVIRENNERFDSDYATLLGVSVSTILRGNSNKK